jgi:hypothetical protein
VVNQGKISKGLVECYEIGGAFVRYICDILQETFWAPLPRFVARRLRARSIRIRRIAWAAIAKK